jgi:tRNA(Arg) A34 adenosine deaminase TadA
MLSSRDLKLYGLAKRVAEDSCASDRHGAVLAHNGRVLAVAANHMNGHPVSEQWGKDTQHAEQRVVKRALGDGATCYTARDHMQDTSRPCDMCMALLARAGVRRVVYSRGLGVVVAERLDKPRESRYHRQATNRPED